MKHDATALRRLIAWLILATMLFARVAGAGYVCPMDETVPGQQSVVGTAECLDIEQPTLCAEYRHNDRTVVSQDGHPPDGDLPPALFLLYVLALPHSTWAPTRVPQFLSSSLRRSI